MAVLPVRTQSTRSPSSWLSPLRKIEAARTVSATSDLGRWPGARRWQGPPRVGDVRSRRLAESREMEVPRLVLGENACSDECPQHPRESARMTSGGSSQLIAALWSDGEQ